MAAAAFMASTSLYAQSDVDMTSPRYKFAVQPVGTFQVDAVSDKNNTSNPANALPQAIDWYNDGFLILHGADAISSAANLLDMRAGNDEASPFSKWIMESTQIVDLGGEVGKVFCIKGDLADPVFPYGITPSECPEDWGNAEYPYKTPWWHYTTYFDSKLQGAAFPAGVHKARLSITWKVVTEEYSDMEEAFTFVPKDYSNNHKTPDGSIIKCMSADTEEETAWVKNEIDFEFTGDDQNIPLNIKWYFSDKIMRASAFLIKDLKLTFKPTGEPVAKEVLNYTMNPETSLNTNTVEEIVTVVKDGVLSISNLKDGDAVKVYSILGHKVADFTAVSSTEYVELGAKGIYVIKVGDKGFKVLN